MYGVCERLFVWRVSVSVLCVSVRFGVVCIYKVTFGGGVHLHCVCSGGVARAWVLCCFL